MVRVVKSPVLPRGSIVRFRHGRHAMYRVTYDLGDLAGTGDRFSEIEPFPNVFDDEPMMMPSEMLELVDEPLDASSDDDL